MSRVMNSREPGTSDRLLLVDSSMPRPQRAPSETPPLAFLVPLLPLIFSADPINLPRTLLAQSAQQATHYLGLTAEDEEYWTLGRKDEEVSRLRRELVEAGSLDDLHPSSPLFSHDLEELRCLVPLSLPHSPSASCSSSVLGAVLVWEDAVSPLSAAQGGAAQEEAEEEEDDVRPGWTFLELQALSSPSPQSWYPSLDEALAASAAGLVQALGIASGGVGAGMGGKQSMSARGEEKEKLREAMAGYESDAASLRRAAAEDEDEGEGDERNGGAIASAEDFWAGWDDEEGEEHDGTRTPNGREAGAQEEDEETGYWDSYSGVGSQVGEEEDDESQSQLERIEAGDSTPPTPLAPHNPQPSFHFTRDSASSLSSSASHSSTTPDADARPLYFSTTLPPLPDSHFGISPTQPNPEISRFSTTDTAVSMRSGASHYDDLIEPSEDGEEEEEFTPRKLDVVPARSASLAQVVPPPLSTIQQPRPSPAPTRPKIHARTASDILKALPSVPAFPVVSRPRPASSANANGVSGGVVTTQVLEGSVYVNAPGGGGGGSPTRPTFGMSAGSQSQRSPTSPARTPTSASHSSPSASAPRSPIKALPPAPTPCTPTRTVSHSHSHSFASPPSADRKPHTQRSHSSSGVPRTPKAILNGAGGGAVGEGVRSPVRNGGFWALPAAPTSTSSSSSSSSGTVNISAPRAALAQRQGSQTTPLPSLAVFPSTSRCIRGSAGDGVKLNSTNDEDGSKRRFGRLYGSKDGGTFESPCVRLRRRLSPLPAAASMSLCRESPPVSARVESRRLPLRLVALLAYSRSLRLGLRFRRWLFPQRQSTDPSGAHSVVPALRRSPLIEHRLENARRTPLNVDKLRAYIEDKVKGFKIDSEVFQFSFGQSNPTYLLSGNNGKRYVVRTRPPGPLISKTAHAIDREYRILDALGKDGSVPVPKVYHLCKDESVIGRQWYLMEYLKGRKFEDVRMPEIKTKEEREALWMSIIQTLAALHALDPQKIGLGDYGSTAAFYPRQIRSLSKVSQAQSQVVNSKTGKPVGPIPRIDFLLEWYGRNLPGTEADKGYDAGTSGRSLEARVIHGDFKVDNMIFHPTEPRVIGVLDWELSTLGHPYSDLANLLQPFYIPSESGGQGYLTGLRGIPPSALPIPPPSTLLSSWCSHMGLDFITAMGGDESTAKVGAMGNVDIDTQEKAMRGKRRWEGCVSFAFFRLAVITQGIAARVAQGNASSAKAAQHAKIFPLVGSLAVQHIELFADGPGTAASSRAKL
ncbi:hypothetical protein RTG_02326 [Rhodotorula toruloides ATCC 204091]|nr:hypothetical protein RTG_02326 [Rhodotorula toruloides ATCC 204091]